MPIKQNAKKALRQAKKHALANFKVKETLKNAVKAAKKAGQTGEKNTVELLRAAQQALDKAAKKGVIKKNTASRKLSRLAKQLSTKKK
jgi:small subunit ribosomal protein S20